MIVSYWLRFLPVRISLANYCNWRVATIPSAIIAADLLKLYQPYGGASFVDYDYGRRSERSHYGRAVDQGERQQAVE